MKVTFIALIVIFAGCQMITCATNLDGAGYLPLVDRAAMIGVAISLLGYIVCGIYDKIRDKITKQTTFGCQQ